MISINSFLMDNVRKHCFTARVFCDEDLDVDLLASIAEIASQNLCAVFANEQIVKGEYADTASFGARSVRFA